jgi:hypothetical protein
MRKLLILAATGLLAAFSTLTACQQADVSPLSANTFTFGSFYGECAGESCIEIFRLDLTQQTLEEDVADTYPSFTAPYQGRYVPRSQAAYQRALPLRPLLPTQLLDNPATVIGQPDAGDWGGYYVEVTQNGTRRFWLIDTQKANIPPYLHAFTDSLRTHIQALK